MSECANIVDLPEHVRAMCHDESNKYDVLRAYNAGVRAGLAAGVDVRTMNAKPNDIDIAGLRELEAKATNANWACPKEHKDGTVQVYATHNGPLRCCVPVCNTMKDDGKFIVALRNAALELLALAEIGQAVQKIRPDEWEYMLKTFEAGNDRQWAIACEIRKALVHLARKDG